MQAGLKQKSYVRGNSHLKTRTITYLGNLNLPLRVQPPTQVTWQESEGHTQFAWNGAYRHLSSQRGVICRAQHAALLTAQAWTEGAPARELCWIAAPTLASIHRLHWSPSICSLPLAKVLKRKAQERKAAQLLCCSWKNWAKICQLCASMHTKSI